jgi:hypothetical protein
MHPKLVPLAQCPRRILATIGGVLTDSDDTFSTHGRLTAGMDHLSRWVTRARSGEGFVELARALIARQSDGR